MKKLKYFYILGYTYGHFAMGSTFQHRIHPADKFQYGLLLDAQ